MAETETHHDLTIRYEDFLRGERYNLVERIATAVDDYMHQARRINKHDTEAVGFGCPRVRIGMSEIRSEDPRLSQRLRRDPLRHLRALEEACHTIASDEREQYVKRAVRIKVALGGPIGAMPSSPRGLTSTSLRHLICVEGVATKVSSIKPKVVKSVHFCPATKKHESKDYVDATDPALGLELVDGRRVTMTNSVYPTKDKDGNPTETEFGLSTFKDHQTITLQEMPERAPMGQLPRSVELVLDHDLVDRVKPGDRVQVVGVYRALATSANGQVTSSGVFKTVVLVNNVQILGRDSSHLTFTPEDVRVIRSLARRDDILDILGRSFAPSIHGHDQIKKALALQQLEGCERNLANGTHLRGSINILMVGDPSTAKSQLLRSAMTMAPLAVSTTGKGSSGVGLTAAVTSDPDTRERRLEAGAMVLADRGLVCVDEFDKMGENDRVAIHEAMEQQTVTIAKAGIHASLNARCAVLAAANPVYGQYDRKRRIQENIGLPDSLLSRFDLLFVVLDQIDPEIDRRIASHVIRGHRHRPGSGRPGYDSDDDDEGGGSSDEEDDNDEDGGIPKVHSVWQRGQNFTHGTGDYTLTQAQEDPDPHSSDVLQHEFLRKYFHFAKARMMPTLTEGARECIANRYAEMRSRQDERTLPITARSLETVIRLATAHAKARLSETVEAEPDCSAAMDILGFALYHENNDSKQSGGGGGSSGAGATGGNDAVPAEITDDDEDVEGTGKTGTGDSSKRRRIDDGESASSDIKARIWAELAEEEYVALDELCVDVTDRSSVISAIRELEEENRVLFSEDMVYRQ